MYVVVTVINEKVSERPLVVIVVGPRSASLATARFRNVLLPRRVEFNVNQEKHARTKEQSRKGASLAKKKGVWCNFNYKLYANTSYGVFRLERKNLSLNLH